MVRLTFLGSPSSHETAGGAVVFGNCARHLVKSASLAGAPREPAASGSARSASPGMQMLRIFFAGLVSLQTCHETFALSVTSPLGSLAGGVIFAINIASFS